MLAGNEILFEDNHLLIVNKKAGLPVQNDKSGDASLLDLAREYVRNKYHKPGNVFIGLPHRIDRPVSGVVILCKTSKSLSRIAQAFKSKKIIKTYLAIVTDRPVPSEGNLIHWISKNSKNNKVTVYRQEHEGALRSELSYKIVGDNAGYYLLQVNPLTGRPHQIRAQLSKINCPIAGDVKYGAPEINREQNIGLHSASVNLNHPVSQLPLLITAPLPETRLWSLFKNYSRE